MAPDYTESARWYRKSAYQGNVVAQSMLGKMYVDGTDVPRDYAEAVHWNQEAAVQGYSLAQVAIGEMYYKGQGVTKDFERAVGWYRIAAEQAPVRHRLFWVQGICLV